MPTTPQRLLADAQESLIRLAHVLDQQHCSTCQHWAVIPGVIRTGPAWSAECLYRGGLQVVPVTSTCAVMTRSDHGCLGWEKRE